MTPSPKKSTPTDSTRRGSRASAKDPGAKGAKGGKDRRGKDAKGDEEPKGGGGRSAKAGRGRTKGSQDAEDAPTENKAGKGAKGRVLASSAPARGSGRARAKGATGGRSRRDPDVDAPTDAADDDPTTDRDEAATPAVTGWRALLAPQGANAAERVRPWWGMGDVAMWGVISFVVLPVLVSIPIAALLTNMGYDLAWPTGDGARLGEAARQFANGETIELTRSGADVPLWLYQLYISLPLWIGFVVGPVFVSVRKGLGFVQDWKVRMRLVDVPLGLGVGLFAQLVMVAAVYRLIFLVFPEQDVSARARELTERANSPLMIVFLLLAVGVVTPVAEELFFRGLSHQAFKRRLGRWWGATATSVLFAITHGDYYLMPPLFLFAFALSWLVDRFDRLGPAIWAHIGFNMVTAVSMVWGLGT